MSGLRRLAAGLVLVLVVSCGGGPAPSPTTTGPAAPDFSLRLGDGGRFVLSEETRPVFMVFWAEW